MSGRELETGLQQSFARIAQDTWRASREPIKRYVRTAAGLLKRDARGLPVERDALKIPRTRCPHCGESMTPLYAGYRVWTGGDMAPEGEGLYLTVLARCKWSARFLGNLCKLSPKGKHMRGWRPRHDAMMACGEVFDFRSVRVMGFGLEAVKPAPDAVGMEREIDRHMANCEAEAALAGAAG